MSNINPYYDDLEGLAQYVEAYAFKEWDSLVLHEGYAVMCDEGKTLDWSAYLFDMVADLTGFEGDEYYSLDNYVEDVRSIIGV